MSLQENDIAEFRHFPALDGLRGLAVLIVMFSHAGSNFPILGIPTGGCFLGVDVFFVLSGFVITSILLKEHHKTGKISLKNFYVRRVFRLTPAYWTFLVFLYFFGGQILKADSASVIYDNYNFPIAFLYLTNWSQVVAVTAITGHLSHLWSLCVEEQFYLLWAVILFISFKEERTRRNIFFITLTCIASLAIARAVRAYSGAAVYTLYFSTDTRIDSLFIGCATSMVYMWKILPETVLKSRRFSLLAFAALLTAVFILLTASWQSVTLYAILLPLFSLSIGVIVLWLISHEGTQAHQLLEDKLLVWVGLISYGLYLWHCAMFEFSVKMFPTEPIQIFVGLFLAFLFSTVSFYLIEKPFLRLKNKFNYRSQE